MSEWKTLFVEVDSTSESHYHVSVRRMREDIRPDRVVVDFSTETGRLVTQHSFRANGPDEVRYVETRSFNPDKGRELETPRSDGYYQARVLPPTVLRVLARAGFGLIVSDSDE